MDRKTWAQRIDDYITAENARVGEILPVYRIFCQDDSDRSGGGIYNETVTIDTIGRFARAIGDSNPLYTSPAYAAKTRWGGIVAPPLIEACVVSTFVAKRFPKVAGMQIFDAGTRWERFVPIRPGDTFSAENRYLGVKDISKINASGRLLLTGHQLSLKNQHGERAAVVTARAIVKCLPPNGIKKKKNESVVEVRPQYTQEELNAVYDNLSAQFDGKCRRGKTPRYWEDVQIGSALPKEMVGPYDESDAQAIMAAIGAANAFATKWGKLRGRRRQVIDPATGAVRDPIDRHLSDAIARVQGQARAIAPGVHAQALIAKTVSDWMGDDGMLKTLDCQCRKPLYFGDLSVQSGVVTRKFKRKNQNGETENCVELEIKAARQDGVVHTQATAVVALPSRQAAK